MIAPNNNPPADCQNTVRRSVTITIPLNIAETLQAFIDAAIGSSCDDDFTREMRIVLKRLDRQVLKHSQINKLPTKHKFK